MYSFSVCLFHQSPTKANQENRIKCYMIGNGQPRETPCKERPSESDACAKETGETIQLEPTPAPKFYVYMVIG